MSRVFRCSICEQIRIGNGIEIEDGKVCCAICYWRYVRPAALMRIAEKEHKNNNQKGDENDD